MTKARPSWSFGLRTAAELWRVVAAVFVVSELVFVPAQIVLQAAAGEALGHLPDDGLPVGEIALILVEQVGPVWPALLTAALSGWCALWLWTVLWHAGVVRWLVFSGRRDVRLAEILSRGLLHWWRWARLALTSVAAIGLGHAGVWVGYRIVTDRAATSELLIGVWLVTLAGLALLVVLLAWLAGLRGAWLLGEPGRRSAVLAWVDGLAGTLRQPVSSVLTLVLWAVPAVAAAALPLIAGWRLEALRGPLAGAALGGLAGLIQAFCWVGLFASFAPVRGVGRDGPSAQGPGREP
ncbi:MAG: hypothetical protein MUC56_13095 [Thermoanaerobaculales bacterium]|nr:hypothetical protein [Thermoanaerobaculales bacterium]